MARVEIEWQILFFSFSFARVTEVRHISITSNCSNLRNMTSHYVKKHFDR